VDGGIRRHRLQRGLANGRNRRSPLIDRRHAKVWISVSQPPLIQPRSRPCEQFHQAVILLKVSVLNLGCNPLGAGAAQPPPGRASSRLTARPARIWQARRLPRCRDSAPCFPASCAREAAAPLSGCPFSYYICAALVRPRPPGSDQARTGGAFYRRWSAGCGNLPVVHRPQRVRAIRIGPSLWLTVIRAAHRPKPSAASSKRPNRKSRFALCK
jgi:hypothetical protein